MAEAWPPPDAGSRPTIRCRFDPANSRFTVQAFAGGLLSFAAHSPVFNVTESAGEVEFPGTPGEGGALWLTVPAAALQVTGNVRPTDRQEIEGRMRQEVLEVHLFPEVRFQSETVAASPAGAHLYRWRISGTLALHGVQGRHTIEAQVQQYEDGIRLSGECALRLSEYRIRPVTALGGTIRLQDQLRLAFDLVAWKQQGGPGPS